MSIGGCLRDCKPYPYAINHSFVSFDNGLRSEQTVTENTVPNCLRLKKRQILKYFTLDIEATKIAQLTGLNRNTINKYIPLVRKVIALECEQESPFSGEVESEEYFVGVLRRISLITFSPDTFLFITSSFFKESFTEIIS